MGHAAQTAFSKWLREEMPKRGFPLDGPRAGGPARLADEAGVSRASMSRIVAGDSQPSIDALRGIGRVFEKTLGEMMVIAEMATPEEMAPPTKSPTKAGQGASQEPDQAPAEHFEIHAVPAIQLGREGDPDPKEILGELAPHEWRIWSETAVPWPARLAAIRGMRQAEHEVSLSRHSRSSSDATRRGA